MPTAKKESFFNPGVTVDIVIFTVEGKELKALFVERADVPFKGAHALPGGFIHKGETSREAAVRVLRDKAGISDVYIEQLYTFDDLGRDPRGQILSIAYFALVPREKLTIASGPLTERPQLIAIRDLPALAFDHAAILAYAAKRLTDKIQYSNVIYSLLPRAFTLTELQATYEAVMGTKIDKRNFRKKFLTLGLISATKKMQGGTRQRPARLYRFKDMHMKELPRFMNPR